MEPPRASDALIPYALRGDRIVHVSEVPRGLACGCVCARCKRALIARKGSRRRHHFAHAVESNCDGGVETLLHRLGKELLAELEVIHLPEYRFHRSHELNGQRASIDRVVVPAMIVAIDRVQIEAPIGSIIPDVIIERGDRKLLVEVEVTHPVDRAKLRVVRKLNVAMLQIRLDRADVHLPREALKLKIERDDRCKQWLFNPRQREEERDWIAIRRQLVRMVRATRDAGNAEAVPGVARRPLPTWTKHTKPKDDSALWRDFDAWAYRHQQITGKPPSLDAYRRHARRIRPA